MTIEQVVVITSHELVINDKLSEREVEHSDWKIVSVTALHPTLSAQTGGLCFVLERTKFN
jgi:hypothetical protein